jgi:hypothetical protein
MGTTVDQVRICITDVYDREGSALFTSHSTRREYTAIQKLVGTPNCHPSRTTEKINVSGFGPPQVFSSRSV